MRFYKQKYTNALWILIHLIVCIKSSHQLQDSSDAKPNNKSATTNTKDAVEDIVQDTFLLLDALDQKLATVKNQTPSALMRDNLRALDGTSNEENEAPFAGASPLKDEVSLDEALVKMANGFTLGRKHEDQMVEAASEQQNSLVGAKVSKNNSETIHQKSIASASLANITFPASDNRGGLKKTRQLLQTAASDHEDHLANDSTERHIRFTLDLMQSIFASQQYTAKSNQIESFVISPISIQMVLMMMHLGARGQTRREISNCLHLDKAAPLSSSILPSGTGDLGTLMTDPTSKLKRRHQHQQLLASSSSETGNKQLTANGKVHNSRQQLQQAAASSSGSGSNNLSPQPAANTANPHELFGAAMRNLLKDPIVVKAFTSANQIFLQKNLPLSAQYEWAIRHYYGADVKPVDFHHQTSSSSPLSKSHSGNGEKGKLSRDLLQLMQNSSTLASSDSLTTNVTDVTDNNIQQMINDWIERQTKGKITNFLSSPVPTSTLLMAINVLYFKGDWQYKFDPTDTETDAWFTQANGNTVKLPMMVNRLPLAFAHDPIMKTSVIELPYKAQRLGLFLLLPDDVSGIFHTMQMLNSTSFANLISSMRKPSPSTDQSSNGINVRIPRFSIESSPRLSQILSQQLGLKSLFMPDSADLSGMFAWQSAAGKQKSNGNGSLSTSDQQIPLQVGLDELLHKAVLQVDEQGSTAAASSATIVERVGLFNSNYFEADHPFLLFLMDKQTGLVLFSGAFAGNAQEGNSGNDKIMHSNNKNTDNTRNNKQD